MPLESSARNRWLLAALLALAYTGAARLGLLLDAVSGFATLVWPPSGIALAAVLLWGPRLWPGVALGALAVNLWVGAPLPAAAGIAAGNTLEALAASYLLARLGFSARLERVRDMVLLIIAAASGATLIAATFGTLSLSWAGVVPPEGAMEFFRAWWLGDLAGVLLFAPFLLSLAHRRWRRPSPARALEAVALVVVVAAITAVVFGDSTDGALPYLLFPAFVWAALRFELPGVGVVLIVATGAAIFGTAAGLGPFGGEALHDRLIQLQTFMAIEAVGALVLAAAVRERGISQAALLEAVRARDEFLSVAAHELRTPLTALVLQLGSVAQRVDHERRSRASLDKALAASARLSRLVDALLDLSRLQRGPLVLEHTSVDLSQLVHEVVERTLEHAKAQGCELRLEVQPGVTGRWDRDRLDQVFTNLLGNALKYGGDSPVVVRLVADADRATLEVIDQGIGIPEQDQERIFARFERAVPTGNYPGLGLGLYVAQHIVQAHGGVIEVESRPAKGATFRVSLPRVPPATP